MFKNLFFCIIFLSFSSLFAHNLALDAEYCLDCQEKQQEMTYYSYPNKNLVSELKEKGVKSIKIFGYGSLIDPKSAGRTLNPEALKTLKPAVAFGVKRLFSRDIPIETLSRWKTPKNKNARGALNLLLSDFHDMVNGVVFEVDLENLQALIDREVGYDLVPIVVKDWEDAVSGNPSNCYIVYAFYAPPESEYVTSSIDPLPGYYELCRDAAKSHGPLYYYLWFSTTYMADGKTPIIEWEKLVEKKHSLTQVEE